MRRGMWRRTRTDQANTTVKLGVTNSQAWGNHADFTRRRERIEEEWRESEKYSCIEDGDAIGCTESLMVLYWSLGHHSTDCSPYLLKKTLYFIYAYCEMQEFKLSCRQVFIYAYIHT